MKIVLAFALALTSALVACGAADESRDPAPPTGAVSPSEEHARSSCIQRIQCKDGNEYCCKTNTCVPAACEPPVWDRFSCTCR
jgi:hypothetical protein